ncbi:ferredoxin [Paraburkholderia sp. GAS32]|jgi:ferredoxin|uniref:ferredoxin n=1 Tax=Paraburkholderia sp. GAS32 TaxID=3035129 RepID=UPI003D24CDCB
MKIIADRAKCAGHARCAAVSEELFELDESGYIAFDSKPVPPGMEALARRGTRACPERALMLDEEEAPGTAQNMS